MDTITRRPFLVAFFVALAGMPLDIFAFNQRQVGTARLSPWARGPRVLAAAASGLWRRLHALVRTSLFWQLAAAGVLVGMMATHPLHAPHGVVLLAGLTTTEIREQINKFTTDMKALMTKAREENRELNDTEGPEFDRMDGEREKLIVLEKRLLRMAELEGSAGRRTDPVPPTQQPRGSSTDPRGTIDRRDDSLVLRGFFDRRRRTAETIEAARRLGANMDDQTIQVALARRPPASKRSEDLRDWDERLRDPEERIEQRDLTAGVFSPDNTGHFALQPSEMLRSLEIALLDYGGMRSVASVLRTDTGVPLPYPTMNDTSNEGAIIGETVQETNDVEPTLGQMVLHAFTYSSRKIPVSIEFMQDNAINFEARVGEILGTRIARITNRHFTVGTGSGQPTGIVTAATNSGVTTASPTAFTYDEIMNLEHSVDPAYRMRGPNGSKFMFNDTTLLALKKIKVPHFSGDTGGWPLWRPGLTIGEPDTIDGYQYVINQHMPAPTGGLKAMIFGALNKYQIRDVRLIEIVRLNELRAEYREVVWMAWYRGDGNLLDAGTHPVKYLTVHA